MCISSIPFQFLHQTVHFHFGQEIDDVLTVSLAEILEVFVGRTVDGQHDLIHGILVAHEFHSCLGELLAIDVHLDDIPEDVQVGAEVLRLNLRDVERALALGQSWHVCVQNVEECPSCGCLPSLCIHHHQYLIRSTAGDGEYHSLLAAG